MEMIEKYLYAVTHKLPERQRMDIEKELRGLIDDMLEERIQAEAPTKQEIDEVLGELGNPNDLAERYREHKKYLIGPDLFDTYLVVLKIVGYSILIALSVVFAIESILTPVSILEHFVDYIVSLITGGAQGFAWVTLVFWLNQHREVSKVNIGGKPKREWSPDQLPAIPNRTTQIKPSEPIIGIIFSVLFMVVIIFSNKLIGVHVINGEGVAIISLFDKEVFRGFLPFLYGLFGLGILRECMKLITRQWNIKLVLLSLIFNAVSFVIALILLHDQAIWNPNFIHELVDSGVLIAGGEGYDTVSSIWRITTERFIHMIGIVLLIDSIVMIYKVSKGRWALLT